MKKQKSITRVVRGKTKKSPRILVTSKVQRVVKKNPIKAVKKKDTKVNALKQKADARAKRLKTPVRLSKIGKGPSLRRTKRYSRSTPKQRQIKSPLQLEKSKQNPILMPQERNAWESGQTFNPAALHEKGTVHLLYRAQGNDGVSRVGYAKTRDGYTIEERSPYPVYIHGDTPTFHVAAHLSGGGFGGVEDPRLTRIDNKVYMTYLAFDGDPRVTLTSIEGEDFFHKRWNWSGPVPISPAGELHKNWVIFPEKIGGKFAILHSISPRILVDYFDTLDFDGKTYIRSAYKAEAESGGWESHIRGVGPPPISTDYGWLVLYHAIDRRDPGKYKLGAMLLDKKEPTRVLYRCQEPILEPNVYYENEGYKGGIVYTCGAVAIDDRLLVYYGGADTVVCVASADLQQFLQALMQDEKPKLQKVDKRESRSKN